ncbi:MAG: phosphoadenylyl-sulfate reductase [Cyclobacteriaceae bacterium]
MSNFLASAGTTIQAERSPLISNDELDRLNNKYSKLTPEARISELFRDFDPNDVMFTSSFGTTGVFMLHLFTKQHIKHPVYFIDTTFHFKETIEYKERLTKFMNLEVRDIVPEPNKTYGDLAADLWQYDPDLCCKIHKNEPFQQVKSNYKVWISGLMSWQSEHRKKLKVFEFNKGMLKFHPILDVTEAEAYNYIKTHNLPEHPLKPLGYESIGCKHCTIKGEKRKGRWPSKEKTECGLHL